ncbi:hypothetical protein [Burkholderia sp. L27(2015)]|uniref:hypothetical protein n=1 Tax=Burkholderia sp. L27(2015) TaxID=1641858 RepID=UPI00131ECDCF|nr:hypothetical protein [Burkholderia sp. L27(2015)]
MSDCANDTYEPFKRFSLFRALDDPPGHFWRYLGWNQDSDKIAVMRVESDAVLPSSRVPVVWDRQRTMENWKDKWEIVSEVVMPVWMQRWDDTVHSKKNDLRKLERDARWQKIGAMVVVGKDRLLFDSKYRMELVEQAAKVAAVSKQRILRLLTVYWWFGGDKKKAMLPLRPRQGGPGAMRIDINTAKPGAKLSTLIEDPDTKLRGVKMTRRRYDQWKNFLLRRAEEIHKSKGKVGLAGQFTITDLWEEFRETELVQKTKVKGVLQSYPIAARKLPRRRRYIETGTDIFRQFVLKQYFDGEYDWDAARAKIGHGTDGTRGRIDVYELDGVNFNAQLLWGPDLVLNRVGKATVVFAACQRSTAIVGINISIQSESANAYRKCLFNAFTPKKEMLRRLGLSDLEEGFVYGPCDEAVFDRGSGIARSIRKPLSEEMKVGVRIARPRKGRDKPLIEAINKFIQKALSRLPGFYQRSKTSNDKDAKSNSERWACIQFEEFVRLVLTFVHDWNTTRNIFERLPEHMVRAGVGTTPRAYFQELRKERMADAAIEWIPKDIYRRLLETVVLPVSEGTVTYKGATFRSDALGALWQMTNSTPSGRGEKLEIRVKPHPDTNQFLIWELDDGGMKILRMMRESREHYGKNPWLIHDRIKLRGSASKYETEVNVPHKQQLPKRRREAMAMAAGLKPTKKKVPGAKAATRKDAVDAEKRADNATAQALFGVGGDDAAPVSGSSWNKKLPEFYNPDEDRRFVGDA